MHDTKKEYNLDEDLVKMDEWQLTSIARLEKHILDYYIAKGYVVGVGEWGFHVHMYSEYKNKSIHVFFNGHETIIARGEKLEDAFRKVYEHFFIH